MTFGGFGRNVSSQGKKKYLFVIFQKHFLTSVFGKYYFRLNVNLSKNAFSKFGVKSIFLRFFKNFGRYKNFIGNF